MESSFQIAICKCPDINASTMTVDSTGRFAMISGRKSLGLIDLDGNDCDASGSTDANSEQQQKTISSQRTAATVSPPKVAPICKKMVRNSKYEPTASHFNRHLVDLFALTTYQVVEIFSIDDLNPLKPKLILKNHSRAITDIEWSHFDPHVLGSSGADCLTNIWDIRDSRRPAACLSSVSGATQVRFSKTSSNLIATSHEIDIRLWDIRQPHMPLNYIAAHLQKINGMDWNPHKTCEHEHLITCSQDNTIKLWDTNANKIKPSATLQTRTPAWRIRYTPVSPQAILTSTLPQLRSRNECMALKLWSMKPNRYENKKLEMILGLVGHTDVIVDFDWRNRPLVGGCCEIISWSKDQTLRVWRVDNQFIEMNVDNSYFDPEEVQDTNCDSVEMSSMTTENTLKSPEPQTKQDLSASSILDSSDRSIRTATSEQQNTSSKFLTASDQDEEDDNTGERLPTTNELKQEFNLINKSIPNIEFDELNWLRRVCLVTARAKSITCRLRIALPPNYPHTECPIFTMIDSDQYGSETLSKEAKGKLLNLLNETAKSQLSRNRNCLEPCLRKFIAALQKMTSQSSYRRRGGGGGSSHLDYKDDPITLSAQRDHSVPFPPTSGASFCGNLLVCFGRPMLPTINMSSGGESANWLVETPRSMAQLSAQLDNMRRQGSYNLSSISISYFYYGAMRRAELQSRTSSGGKGSSSSTTGGGGRTSSSKYLAGRSKTGTLSSQSMLSKNYKCGPVIVYDASSLLGGICRELAENYVFDKDVIKMCRRNAEIAAAHNRRDLVQIWSLAELSSEGVLRSYMPTTTATKEDAGEKAFSLINPDSDFGDRPWTMHPFGSKLIQSLIDHYVYNCHDVQTAAMLVWTFSSPKLGRSVKLQNTKFSSNYSAHGGASQHKNPIYNMLTNYHTVIPGMMNYSTAALATKQVSNNMGIANNTDAISDEWSFVNVAPETHLYSNSWSNSTNEMVDHHLVVNSSGGEMTRNSSNTIGDIAGGVYDATTTTTTTTTNSDDKFPRLNILSPERSLQNDLIMHIYAEFLYRLNLLNQRAMVLKNIGSNSAYSELFGDKQTLNDIPDQRLPSLTVQCNTPSCRNNKCRSVQCCECKKYSLYCGICRLPVKGSCSICSKCLHGGHVTHFDIWFSSYDFCPTGCGCKCLSSD